MEATNSTLLNPTPLRCGTTSACFISLILIATIAAFLAAALIFTIVGYAMCQRTYNNISDERNRLDVKDFLTQHGVNAAWRTLWGTSFTLMPFKTEGWTKEHHEAMRQFKISFHTAREHLETVMEIQQREGENAIASAPVTSV